MKSVVAIEIRISIELRSALLNLVEGNFNTDDGSMRLLLVARLQTSFKRARLTFNRDLRLPKYS